MLTAKTEWPDAIHCHDWVTALAGIKCRWRQELEDRHLGLRRKSAPARIIKNGMDQQIFRPPDIAPAVGNYILYVGRLVEQKGMEYLIRAFFCIREKFPDLHLHRLKGQGVGSGCGVYGGSGSRVSPVWARNPPISSGRYWMRLSRFLLIAASWSTSRAIRLPRPFFMFAQTPSAGLRSGA